MAKGSKALALGGGLDLPNKSIDQDFACVRVHLDLVFTWDEKTQLAERIYFSGVCLIWRLEGFPQLDCCSILVAKGAGEISATEM